MFCRATPTVICFGNLEHDILRAEAQIDKMAFNTNEQNINKTLEMEKR